MSMISAVRRMPVCCTTLLLVLAVAASALGQRATLVVDVFQPAPSDVRRPLSRAQRGIDEGQFSDAVFQLGALLMSESTDDAEQQDYFLESADPQSPLRTQGLKAAARRMLAGLPKKGRELYELQFGSQARALLTDAVATGEVSKLTDIYRRFPHTQAGYEAAMLMGRFELARRRPIAAALCFRRVAECPEVAQFEPELSVLTSMCWLYANMPDRARDTLVALKKSMPDVKVAAGSEMVPLFADDSTAVSWLNEIVGSRRAVLPPEETSWVMFRGNPQRNARTIGSLPLMNYRWYLASTLDHQDEKIVNDLTKGFHDRRIPAIPASAPLAVGDVVLMRTPRKLLGVDFKSGKRVWLFPPYDDVPIDSDAKSGESRFATSVAETRQQELTQRIWHDAVHGQISSDGQSVYLLDQVGYAPTGNRSMQRMFIGRGGVAARAPGAPVEYNRLVSLDLAKEGKLQWIVGGRHGEEEPRLAGAFFLGPPLPLDDKLYVQCEVNGEIRLVVLAAETGQLLWQQQLAHVDTRTILFDGARRLAGATPSYADGVLVCPTGAGAVVAVDISTRTLLWGHQYLTPTRGKTSGMIGFNQFQANPPKELGTRWAEGSVTIADGRVLLTPIESDSLYCFDLLSGENAWPPQKREERLYIACVHESIVVLAGTDNVSAINLTDGKPAWSKPVPLAEPPSGRGFYSGSHYFLPTAGRELLKIDVNTGQVESRTQTSEVLGNLVCYRDELISHSGDRLSLFYQSEPLRGLVDERLANDPKDAWALARKGELMLQDGNSQDAIAMLRHAYELDRDDDANRALLVTTLLQALEDDFAANQHYSSEIKRLIDLPSQRSEFLRLMAVGLQRTGKVAEAFDAYLELAKLRGNLTDGLASTELEVERVARGLNVRLDRWLESRFSELLSAADESQIAKMDDTIRAYYDRAMESDDISTLRRFVRFFGAHASADEVRLRLAGKLVDASATLEAELLLNRLAKAASEDIRAGATAEMARLLSRANQYELAAEYYQQLAELWPNRVFYDNQTGQQLHDVAMQDRFMQEVLSLPESWPNGLVKTEEKANSSTRYPSYRRVYRTKMRQSTGPSPKGLNVSYDQQANSLIVLDGWGQTITQVRLGSRRLNTSDYSLTHARANGHLLLVSTGVEVLAIDILQATKNPAEAILWRRSLMDQGTATNIYQMHVRVRTLRHPLGSTRRIFVDAQNRPLGVTGPVTDGGIYYIHSRELICADPLSGETIWSRDNLPQGCDLFGDEQYIFAVPPESTEAMVFSAADGSELGQRKVDALDNRWTTLGRNVLAWRQVDSTSPIELRLYDAWSGNDIWKQSLSAGSKGCLIGQDELALLDKEGSLVVRNMRDDSVSVTADVESEEALLSLHAMRSDDQYIIATNRPFQSNQPHLFVQPINGGTTSPIISGDLYAFDRATGKPSWESPVEIERFGFPTEQPSELPMVMLLRHVRPRTPRGTSSLQTSILCLNRRDGRVLIDRDDIPVQTYTYDVVADRKKQTVAITLPRVSFTMLFTDEPIPPAQKEKPSAQAEEPSEEAKADQAEKPVDAAKGEVP